ncbi:MAG TPA: hypothetical protein VFO25_14025 [Candidatus Eremiobacteraceae bacterium]|nr:hypothetical protein [Candidatus Eremiobacteraceae bacterium]
MTLNDLNAIAPIVTAIVIAATAVAALVQLRHMRAANHIGAMWSVHEMFSDAGYIGARRYLRTHLARLVADPGFRGFATMEILGHPPANPPEEYITAINAATLIANTHEMLGNMIVQGLINREVMLRGYAWVIDGTWRMMEEYVKILRAAEGGDGLFEDFEYMTVCSRDWIKHNPVSYPKGYGRILPSFSQPGNGPAVPTA